MFGSGFSTEGLDDCIRRQDNFIENCKAAHHVKETELCPNPNVDEPV